MMYLIAYTLISLVVMQRVFITIIRNEVDKWGEIDPVETVAFALIAFLLGVIWPLTVLVYTIYRYILEPMVQKLNKEGK